MKDQPSDSRKARRRPSIWTCCGCTVGIPVVAVLILAAIFRVNNQPPDIVIPTHSVPADNAYDDFVRVGAIMQVIPHKAPASLPNPLPESQMLAVTKACSEDAAPGLAILRRALDKPY